VCRFFRRNASYTQDVCYLYECIAGCVHMSTAECLVVRTVRVFMRACVPRYALLHTSRLRCSRRIIFGCFITKAAYFHMCIIPYVFHTYFPHIHVHYLPAFSRYLVLACDAMHSLVTRNHLNAYSNCSRSSSLQKYIRPHQSHCVHFQASLLSMCTIHEAAYLRHRHYYARHLSKFIARFLRARLFAQDLLLGVCLAFKSTHYFSILDSNGSAVLPH
jgi:hypothetical protein